MAEYFESEVEALLLVHGGEACASSPRSCVRTFIKPYAALQDTTTADQDYCCCTLMITWSDDDGPDSVSVQVEDARMEDNAKGDLATALQDQLTSLRGEPGLFCALAEAAKVVLTQHNKPEGLCAVCRDEFQVSAAAAEVVKLPCWHLLHTDCAAHLASFQAREAGRRRREELERSHQRCGGDAYVR